jgi:hypothetical protein
VEDPQPTGLTVQDIENFLNILEIEPRKCACGRGHAVYEVMSRGEIWDHMCFACFQEVTKDGRVIWTE